MMMTQWGLGQREHDARAKRASRAMAIVKTLGLALSLAMPLAGGWAKAAEHPLRVRHVAVARYTDHTPTHAARPRAKAASAHAHSVRAGGASSKPAAGKHYQARSRSATPVQARAAARPNAARPAELHRVSARRRHSARRGYRKQIDVVAQTRDDEPTRAASGTAAAAESTDAQAVAPTPTAAADKPLSVDDFVRAASMTTGPESGIYASGVAQPDEDVSLTGLHAATPAASTPRLAARPAEMAHVEAAQRGPAALQRSALSDLVGAPLAAPQRESRNAMTRDASPDGQMTTPTHAELAEEVEQPVVLPGLYRYGRLVVPPPMRGTREILVHQNLIADEEGLTRIQDEVDLRRMRTQRMLVDFPASASLRVNPELASAHRCARPWTVRFAADIARSYYARFHQPLQVNSAVRTVAYQVRLRRVNGNAAGTEGDVASPHLTGEAMDFGKHGMTTAEIAWMRLYLRPLMQDGKLDVEEEFQQACFHISVYRAYAPGLSGPRRRSNARSEVARLGEPVASSADSNQ